MPITYRVDSTRNILFVTRTGSIAAHHEKEAFRLRQADELIVPGMGVVVDCRGVEPADSVEVVRYLTDYAVALASTLQCGAVAIVVAREVEYGMARMYQELTELEHPNTQVFRDYEEALAWVREGGATAA